MTRGEIHGLLGHNGAGKSTTLGIVLAMIAADEGEVMIDGVSVLKDHTKALRKVGAIFEAPAFYDYMSGWNNLRVLVGLSGRFDKKAAEDVVGRGGAQRSDWIESLIIQPWDAAAFGTGASLVARA